MCGTNIYYENIHTIQNKYGRLRRINNLYRLQKVYHSVDTETMMEVLEELRVNSKIIKLI